MKSLAVPAFLSLVFWSVLSGAVSVYRFPEGRFSSGDFSKDSLYPTGETINFAWIGSVDGDSKMFWIKRASVSNSLDFSHSALATVSTPFYRRPFAVARPLGYFKTLTTVALLNRNQNWFHVEFKDGHILRRAWVPENLIQANPGDPGFCVTRQSTMMKQFAGAESKNLLNVPAGTKFTPQGLHNSWVKLTFDHRTGWVSFYDVLSKLDFAKRIQRKGTNQFLDVSSVSGNWFTLTDHSMVSLDQVSALETDPFQVIATEKSPWAFVLPSPSSGRAAVKMAFGQKLAVRKALDVVWVRAGDGEGDAVWYRSKSLASFTFGDSTLR